MKRNALILLGLVLAAASAEAQQFNGTALPTDQKPVAVATGDLNGDGILDLVTANEDGRSVSVLLGLGRGTFAAHTDFPVPAPPRSVTLADFNSDGKTDVVVTSSADNAIFLLLGQGDGTLLSATRFATGTAPVHVAVGDLNADGHMDLVTANNVSNSVSVFLGRGDGTFTNRNDFPTSTAPVFISLSDFNRDGKPDIVTANFVGRNISALLGNGDGSFQPAQHFQVGAGPSAVVAMDGNRDSKPDVATANRVQNSVSFLLGRGDGTFDPRTDLGTDTEPIAITAADFNKDGLVDLVTSNVGYFSDYYGYGSSSFSLLFGNGNGTFRARKDFFLPHQTFSGMIAADFDGDGWPDLVATDEAASTVTVYLQGPNLGFDPGSLSFSRTQAPGAPSAPQTLTVTNHGFQPVAVGSVTLTGQNPGDFAMTADNCSGVTVVGEGSCSVSIEFSPASVGRKVAGLSIAANIPGSPAIAPLEGGGGDFSIAAAPGSSASVTVNAGERATYTLSLAAVAGFSDPVTLECQVASTLIGCEATPAIVSFGNAATATATITVATVAPRNAGVPLPGFPPAGSLPWTVPAVLLALAGLGLFARGGSARLRLRLAPATIAFALVLLATACGGASTSPPRPPVPSGGTPPGTYSVNVRATAQGVEHNVTLSLTVR